MHRDGNKPKPKPKLKLQLKIINDENENVQGAHINGKRALASSSAPADYTREEQQEHQILKAVKMSS